jgi:hypothetical protein
MSIAPNALSQLRSRVKGLFKRSKKDDKPTDTTKTAETAATPTEAAAAEAAADPVAAAARKCLAILFACDSALDQRAHMLLRFTEGSHKEIGNKRWRLTLNLSIAEEATKTTDAAPVTTEAVAETKAEEPIVTNDGETTVAKEESAGMS